MASYNELVQEQDIYAEGGDTVFGNGGDATAVGIQAGSISDDDALISLPDVSPNIAINADANILTQFQNVTAFGGNSIFGDGGDATAVGVQTGSISSDDVLVA
jgi:hypothetical protein